MKTRTQVSSLCIVKSVLSVCRQSSSYLQVDDRRGAVALHGVELKVSLEVLGVQTGDGQAVPETGLQHGGDEGRRGSGWGKKALSGSCESFGIACCPVWLQFKRRKCSLTTFLFVISSFATMLTRAGFCLMSCRLTRGALRELSPWTGLGAVEYM